MSLLLVAHGTRKQRGVSLIGDLAAKVSDALDQPVHVAFVDVLGPTPGEVLAATLDRPTVLVPAFLAHGYHVTSDIPAHVQASGHREVTVTRALGPDPELVRVLVDRLIECGWRPEDSVVLAAAGTSDPAAMRDLHTTATWLSMPTIWNATTPETMSRPMNPQAAWMAPTTITTAGSTKTTPIAICTTWKSAGPVWRAMMDSTTMATAISMKPTTAA